MKVFLAVIGLVVITLFAGCTTTTNSQSQGNVFSFIVTDCMNSSSQDAYQKSPVIISKQWQGDTLVVKAEVNSYCNGSVLSGNYSIDGNNIILSYKDTPSATVTRCLCRKELTYNVGIPQGDYLISLVDGKGNKYE